MGILSFKIYKGSFIKLMSFSEINIYGSVENLRIRLSQVDKIFFLKSS